MPYLWVPYGTLYSYGRFILPDRPRNKLKTIRNTPATVPLNPQFAPACLTGHPATPLTPSFVLICPCISRVLLTCNRAAEFSVRAGLPHGALI